MRHWDGQDVSRTLHRNFRQVTGKIFFTRGSLARDGFSDRLPIPVAGRSDASRRHTLSELKIPGLQTSCPPWRRRSRPMAIISNCAVRITGPCRPGSHP